MTAHEEMTKSRVALEKALVGEDAVKVADAIDARIKAFIFASVMRERGEMPSTPPRRAATGDRQETCPRCLESIVHTPAGQVRFEDNGPHHSDRACAERCARNADKCRDALYEISVFLNMSAQNDPPEIAVPRGVREYLTGAARTVLVDGVVYGEHMIRELRERAKAPFEQGRIKGVQEAIELVETSGPKRPFTALVANLKELL